MPNFLMITVPHTGQHSMRTVFQLCGHQLIKIKGVNNYNEATRWRDAKSLFAYGHPAERLAKEIQRYYRDKKIKTITTWRDPLEVQASWAKRYKNGLNPIKRYDSNQDKVLDFVTLEDQYQRWLSYEYDEILPVGDNDVLHDFFVRHGLEQHPWWPKRNSVSHDVGGTVALSEETIQKVMEMKP